MFLYFWEIISAWTFLAVSVAQPTRMRTDVPANPRNAVRCVVCSIKAGPAASIAKKPEPRTDIRLRTYIPAIKEQRWIHNHTEAKKIHNSSWTSKMLTKSLSAASSEDLIMKNLTSFCKRGKKGWRKTWK